MTFLLLIYTIFISDVKLLVAVWRAAYSSVSALLFKGRVPVIRAFFSFFTHSVLPGKAMRLWLAVQRSGSRFYKWTGESYALVSDKKYTFLYWLYLSKGMRREKRYAENEKSM